MKNTKLIPSILLSGIAMGTAWAVRGQFGHEHGAAWAGAVGCMTVVLLSGKADWYRNVFKLILAGGLGWGIGGIMSYGKVIGYCKSTDFGNVYYGFLMLFIIGALYGFVGGGLFGISLSKTKKRTEVWHQLIVEMTVGAILGYFFIIEQFGWIMTPPRSELWAASFGVSLSLIWYMIRNQMQSALRVAVFSAFGAGFGFAFGNLLQVLGNAFEIQFNMWNVMEYTLGFCGGLAMSYAVYTSDWDELEVPSKNGWVLPVVVLTLIIPAIMWQQNADFKEISEQIKTISSGFSEKIPYLVTYLPYVFIVASGWYWIRKLAGGTEINYKTAFNFYALFFGLYILLSIIITGAIFSTYRVEQYLYVLNLAVVLYFLGRLQPTFIPSTTSWRVFSGYLLSMVFIIALIAFVAVSSHEMDLSGTNYRFGEASNPEIH